MCMYAVCYHHEQEYRTALADRLLALTDYNTDPEVQVYNVALNISQ
jgi:hypothetical protein